MEWKNYYRGSHGQTRHFQARFEKVDKFGWWDLERIKTDDVTQFTFRDFQ